MKSRFQLLLPTLVFVFKEMLSVNIPFEKGSGKRRNKRQNNITTTSSQNSNDMVFSSHAHL